MSSGEETIIYDAQPARLESKEIPPDWKKNVTPEIVQKWQAVPVMKSDQTLPTDIISFKF